MFLVLVSIFHGILNEPWTSIELICYPPHDLGIDLQDSLVLHPLGIGHTFVVLVKHLKIKFSAKYTYHDSLNHKKHDYGKIILPFFINSKSLSRLHALVTLASSNTMQYLKE